MAVIAAMSPEYLAVKGDRNDAISADAALFKNG